MTRNEKSIEQENSEQLHIQKCSYCDIMHECKSVITIGLKDYDDLSVSELKELEYVKNRCENNMIDCRGKNMFGTKEQNESKKKAFINAVKETNSIVPNPVTGKTSLEKAKSLLFKAVKRQK